MSLPCVLLSEDATLPTRGSALAAGYDLYAAETINVLGGHWECVRTDIAIALPAGHYGRVAPRSGLSVKKGYMIGAGVIDEDYRGPIGVVVHAHASQSIMIQKGDRIAQLVIEKIATPEVVQVDELPDTARGAGGFGSTGN